MPPRSPASTNNGPTSTKASDSSQRPLLSCLLAPCSKLTHDTMSLPRKIEASTKPSKNYTTHSTSSARFSSQTPPKSAVSIDTKLLSYPTSASGGTLITTGAVGFNASTGSIQLQSLPVTRLLDNLTSVESLWSTYMAPEQNETDSSRYTGPLLPIIGSYHTYEWKNGSESRYKKLEQAPWAPIECTYGNTQVDEGGCGIAAHEAGRAAVFTIPVGRGYKEIGYSVYRDFFQSVFEELGTSERLQFEIAEQVEVTLNRNVPGATVVHLIVSGARSDNFGSHLPIPAGSIRVEGIGGTESVKARALVSEVELEVVDSRIQLPELDLFEVVVIEGLG